MNFESLRSLTTAVLSELRMTMLVKTEEEKAKARELIYVMETQLKEIRETKC